MPLFSRFSLRKLILALLALATGLYLAKTLGYLSTDRLGFWVDSLDHGEQPQKQAALPASPRSSQLTPTSFKRQQAVREATKHAWAAYKQFAWGMDEFLPITKSSNQRWGGWAITLVDSLDTLKLAGLETEYNEAKEFVSTMQFNRTRPGYETQLFEMTIRALGGLLGAYELDNDPMLLKQAKQVGDSLAYAFNTNTGLPATHVDVNGKSPMSSSEICIAEAGTLQLEFKKLSQLTGDGKYAKLVEKVSDIMDKAERKLKGLYPKFINIRTGEYNQDSGYSVGSYADSFYEYLLKQYILHDGKEPKFKERYVESVEAINSKLVKKTDSGFSYLGSSHSDDSFSHTMEHLACFYPGLLALGSHVLDRPQDMVVAKELARTCYHSYAMTPTGLGPDTISFNATETRPSYYNNAWWYKESQFDAYGVGSSNPQYVLRPETVETLFILYRITGDTKYQDWGWNIFLAIEKYTRREVGYAAYVNVYRTNVALNHQNSMESFFLAETLKYLYLLFSPTDLVPLDEYVFNTEAHPLRIIKSK